jgi:hypothetical protein
MAARVGVKTRKARKEREAASEAASLPVRVGSPPRDRLLSGRILHKGQELGRGRSRVLPNQMVEVGVRYLFGVVRGSGQEGL